MIALNEARVPPHSAELEQSLLGAVLLDNRVHASAAEAHFYSGRHRLIFAAMTTLLAKGQVVDVVTVFEYLQAAGQADETGGLPYLNELAQSVPSAANARRYAARLHELTRQRQLIALAGEALEAAWSTREVAELADRCAAQFAAFALRDVARAPRSIAEVALERAEHHAALQEGRVAPGMATRLPWLDQTLNGGLRAGGLYVLAARPSVGKSSLAQGIGLALAEDGAPVLFCSMEMADGEVADRGVANVGRVSYGALLRGRMDSDDWSRASEAIERLLPVPFYVDDEQALTLRAVRAKARSVKGLKVLIVDYLQLMSASSSRRDGNRNAEIEEISRGLKALAKELGIAVIALSQLNRAVETRNGKRPTLSDLRDSGAIEQDADVVMFLWPVREGTDGSRLVGLGVDKNRQGRLGEIGLDFQGDVQRWSQSAADPRPVIDARSRGGDL